MGIVRDEHDAQYEREKFIEKNTNDKIQWHPAFYSEIQMELVKDGETFELLEVSKKELVNGRVVTYRCMDQSLRAVAFKLLVSNKGRFLRFRKCVLESK